MNRYDPTNFPGISSDAVRFNQDPMEPSSWVYSPRGNLFFLPGVAKELDPESFYTWFPNYDDVEKCNHEWKDILLLNSTVYDCIKCGKTKESFEEMKKIRIVCGKEE